MYLFEKQDDRGYINVYGANINYEKSKELKSEFIKNEDITKTLLSNINICNMDNNCFSYEQIMRLKRYVEFSFLKNKSAKEETLTNYVQGLYDHNMTKVIYGSEEDPRKTLYLLFTECPYIKGKLYETDNIILLNKEMYLLKLLESEKFSYLQGEDLSSLKDVIRITDSPINEINYDELKKFVYYGLIKNADELSIKAIVNGTDNVVRTLKRK